MDGAWRCDEQAKKDYDNSGNVNNMIDLTQQRMKPQYEIGIKISFTQSIDENKDYFIARPPQDHFDLNAQPVPIHFTKNLLNSTNENKLSENNVHYQFSDNSENVSFKYSPPPPHVIM